MKAILRASLILVMGLLAACNFNTPLPTPTVEPLVTPTLTVEPSPSPSVTPGPTLEATLTEVVVATGAPTLPPAVPSLPALEITVTEGPYVYVIQEQDTLGFILQKQPWGYPPYDPSVIASVVELNNLANENILPPPGSELLIPRRTPTPIPEGADATATSDANLGTGTRLGNVTLPQGAVVDCYIVVEGDTIIGIASEFNTTLETLSQLNQNLNWFGCQFDTYTGGSGCNPPITINMCVNVPLPSPTPVPSSTPSGNETATPTPTFVPARGFYPPEGAIAPARSFTLAWVSVGILGTNDVYLIEVQDVTLGTQSLQITRNTSFQLPESLIPSDGRPHDFQWRVSVAQKNAGGTYDYVGGVGIWRRFTWQSR